MDEGIFSLDDRLVISAKLSTPHSSRSANEWIENVVGRALDAKNFFGYIPKEKINIGGASFCVRGEMDGQEVFAKTCRYPAIEEISFYRMFPDITPKVLNFHSESNTILLEYISGEKNSSLTLEKNISSFKEAYQKMVSMSTTIGLIPNRKTYLQILSDYSGEQIEDSPIYQPFKNLFKEAMDRAVKSKNSEYGELLLKILPKYEKLYKGQRISHGDLCYVNTIFNSQNDKLIIIDPKLSIGDPMRDLAYWIVTLEGDYSIPFVFQKVVEIFSLKPEETLKLRELVVIEAVLRLAPYHYPGMVRAYDFLDREVEDILSLNRKSADAFIESLRYKSIPFA